ncbi:hypothetical protein [Pseudomonas frederiksbergensis]|uniref:hypothetical protein n=1 Tax=Pseudomonas frederiksbergensis TaxID=104087 RepID=UPI0011CEAC1A|nr:hypothetical protein [Pseudomonas frederiksbergensis]
MSKAKDKSDNSTIHADMPDGGGDISPVITGPGDRTVSVARPIITGTCHPGRNVRVVSIGREDALSPEQQPSNGNFRLTFQQDLRPGLNTFEVLQWQRMQASHRRSNDWHLYHLPAPVITSPVAGATVGRTPTITGNGGYPRAIIQVVKHGNPNVIYGQGTVNNEGIWSVPITVALPVGAFSFTARQQLDGKNGILWAAFVPVTVTG